MHLSFVRLAALCVLPAFLAFAPVTLAENDAEASDVSLDEQMLEKSLHETLESLHKAAVTFRLASNHFESVGAEDMEVIFAEMSEMLYEEASFIAQEFGMETPSHEKTGVDPGAVHRSVETLFHAADQAELSAKKLMEYGLEQDAEVFLSLSGYLWEEAEGLKSVLDGYKDEMKEEPEYGHDKEHEKPYDEKPYDKPHYEEDTKPHEEKPVSPPKDDMQNMPGEKPMQYTAHEVAKLHHLVEKIYATANQLEATAQQMKQNGMPDLAGRIHDQANAWAQASKELMQEIQEHKSGEPMPDAPYIYDEKPYQPTYEEETYKEEYDDDAQDEYPVQQPQPFIRMEEPTQEQAQPHKPQNLRTMPPSLPTRISAPRGGSRVGPAWYQNLYR